MQRDKCWNRRWGTEKNNSHCPAPRRRRRGEAAPSGEAASWLHWKGKVTVLRLSAYILPAASRDTARRAWETPPEGRTMGIVLFFSLVRLPQLCSSLVARRDTVQVFRKLSLSNWHPGRACRRQIVTRTVGLEPQLRKPDGRRCVRTQAQFGPGPVTAEWSAAMAVARRLRGPCSNLTALVGAWPGSLRPGPLASEPSVTVGQPAAF
jgi:hypothetical protein